MSNEPCVRLTADELAAMALFADDDRSALDWLAERFAVRCYAAGDIVMEEGTPVHDFIVVLEGELHYTRPADPYAPIFVRVAGQASGVLPFSRIKVARARGIAVVDSRVAAMPATELRELVYRAPNLAQKLVADMTDRTREFTQAEERSGKLLALGKLSAGLAHELNNPASAARRSSAQLRETLMVRRREAIAMRGEVIPPEAQRLINEISESIAECATGGEDLDALERADREADLSDWLDQHGVPPDMAADLADAGVTAERIVR
ncbi:MAG: hypothetical protein ABI823_01490, partial [Bryobacteraceae bacterium]